MHVAKNKMRVEGKYVEADAEGEALEPNPKDWVVMKERTGLPTRLHGPYDEKEAKAAANRLRGVAVKLRP